MTRSTNSQKSSATSRRKFLKSSAMAAGAAMLGSQLDIARSAYAAGSDTIRVGLIGCGGRNTSAAGQALRADKGARLVALCDIFMDRVQQTREFWKARLGDQVMVDDDHCFTGLDAYKKVIEASDVVLIANAAKFHPLHALTAIQAGKHVFVEKPHGIDPAGMKTMRKACDLAKEKGLSIVSGLQSRFHEGYQETVKRIHDGAIGDIVAIREQWLRPPYGLGPRKPEYSELEWQLSVQYRFYWLCGDDVPQTLVHNLDRSSWVMHNQAPVRCHGMGGRSTLTDMIYGAVYDHNAVVYEFENGVPIYAFCRTTPGCYDNNSSLILGSKGRASLLACRIWGETNWQWEGNSNPYQIEHDVLFKSIRDGEPFNSGDYMVRSTQIGVMGQLSCYTGKEVTWQQMNESDFNYPPKPEDCHDGMEPPIKPGPDNSYPMPKPGVTELL